MSGEKKIKERRNSSINNTTSRRSYTSVHVDDLHDGVLSACPREGGGGDDHNSRHPGQLKSECDISRRKRTGKRKETGVGSQTVLSPRDYTAQLAYKQHKSQVRPTIVARNGMPFHCGCGVASTVALILISASHIAVSCWRECLAQLR